MRIWNVIPIILTMILLIPTATTSRSDQLDPVYDTPLITRIANIDYDFADVDSNDGKFRFNAKVEVLNQQEESITITHPDTCGFAITVKSLETNPEATIYNSESCGDALTEITYTTGFTQTETSVVFTSELASDKIPDGRYSLTYGQPSSIYNELVSFIETVMIVVEGLILIQSEILPPEWATLHDNSTTVSKTVTIDSSETTSYFVTTDEQGSVTTLIVIDNRTEVEQMSENTSTGDGDTPAGASETLDFNILWSIFPFTGLVFVNLIRKRSR
ncbi:MAG: hypothetical protein GPJ54_15275 [Candidatus Heimdallarchaeota archaeon]|nr:hypothetical protein [Candidatus Heimdallarchaeota archaeon]